MPSNDAGLELDAPVEPGRQVRKPKLSERVVLAIRSQLLGGDFRTGDRLPTESQLTARYGVSRTVIREAIARLAADGLVEPRHGAGVFVRRLSSSSIGAIAGSAGNRISHAMNVIEVRMGIEIESAALAASRRSVAQEAHIQEAFFEFERLLSSGEATGKADFAFHRAIATATNNPFYVELLDALGTRAIPCDVSSPWATDGTLNRSYLEGLQREHLRILRAIAAGDSDEARSAMRDHLSASMRRYQARLNDQQADYISGRIGG